MFAYSQTCLRHDDTKIGNAMRTAKELRATRNKAGWSQRQLAEKTGVHLQTVKYWEAKTGYIKGWAVNRFQEAFAAENVKPVSRADFLFALPPKAVPRRRPLCGARNRKGEPCKAKALPGKRRCKFHGGMSTGPRTPEGRNRIAEAQRRRWHEGKSLKSAQSKNSFRQEDSLYVIRPETVLCHLRAERRKPYLR